MLAYLCWLPTPLREQIPGHKYVIINHVLYVQCVYDACMLFIFRKLGFLRIENGLEGKLNTKKKKKLRNLPLAKETSTFIRFNHLKVQRRSDTNGLMYSIQMHYFFPCSKCPQTLKPLVKVLHIPLHLGEPVLHKRSISLLIEDNVLRIHNSHCTLHNASETRAWKTQLRKSKRFKHSWVSKILFAFCFLIYLQFREIQFWLVPTIKCRKINFN